MLRALGYRSIERFHMNEGHSSLLTLELLDESAREAGRAAVTYDDVERVRRKCVFTTHTTVAAGHDQFPVDLVMRFGPAGNLSHERCLLLRGLSQFDLFGFESEPLCQWRRQKTRGNLPADVFRLFNRRNHKRSPRSHVDHKAFSGTLRPLYTGLETGTTSACAML